MDEAEINTAFSMLKEAYVSLNSEIAEDVATRNALADRKSSALLKGEIVGKNEAERDAKASDLLFSEIGACRASEARVRFARMVLDCEIANWERVKYTIRLMESRSKE